MKRVVIIVLLMTCVFGLTSAQTIYNQQQFDEAVKAINKGGAATLRLLPGTYVLNEPINAKKALNIYGESATITAPTQVYDKSMAVKETQTHYVCKLLSTINEFSLFLDENNKQVIVSESVETESLVNHTASVDGGTGKTVGVEFKIPIPANLSNLKNKTFDKAYGYLDCGWTRMNFQVIKSDKTKFYCKTLHTINISNLSYEKTAYKKDIRYVIYNAELNDSAVYYDNNQIYIPKSVKKLSVISCDTYFGGKPCITTKSDVVFSGVNFHGIDGIRITSPSGSQCVIEGCTFEYSLGETLRITKSGESNIVPAYLRNCRFENASILSGAMVELLSGYNGGNSIVVEGCTMTRYPDSIVRYKNTAAMVSINADVLMRNCELYNTCRDHIYVRKGKNELLDNVVYNTDEFNSLNERNLSSDWGMIFIGYIFDDVQSAIANVDHTVLVDGCYIHGAYSSNNDARGIMIDSGRGDITCRNNIIMDCQAYSIDSREVAKVTAASSIRNTFENNVLGTRYRLVAGTEVPEQYCPVSNNNYMVSEFKNVKNDKVKELSEDKVVSNINGTQNGKVYQVNKPSFKALKKTSCFSEVKQHVKKVKK